MILELLRIDHLGGRPLAPSRVVVFESTDHFLVDFVVQKGCQFCMQLRQPRAPGDEPDQTERMNLEPL